MINDWARFQPLIIVLEQSGLVTRTFRRLEASRQEQIVHAILDESADQGPVSLNIRAVAKRAGISVGSLYQYFGDRNGLLEFAIELCVSYLAAIFTEMQPYLISLQFTDALRILLMGGIEWSKTEIGLIRFFGRAAYQGDPALGVRVVLPVARVLRETTEAILVQAVNRGEVRSDIDLEAAARVINSLLIIGNDIQMLPYLNNYFQADYEHIAHDRFSEAIMDLITKSLCKTEG